MDATKKTSLNRNRLRIERDPKYDIKEFTIQEIMRNLEGHIDFLLNHIDNGCSNNLIERVVRLIHGKRKDFKGKNKNEERKKFIKDDINKNYNLIKEEAKFFYENEEDRTDKIHSKKRREIIKNLNLIFKISYFVIDK